MGVYVQSPSVATEAEPWPGPDTLAIVRLASSTSVQTMVPDCCWFLSPMLASSAHAGASFTAGIVSDIVTVPEFAVPSFARNVKLSAPL